MLAEAHMLTCWKVLDRRANLAPRAFYMAWLLERAEDSVKTKREIQWSRGLEDRCSWVLVTLKLSILFSPRAENQWGWINAYGTIANQHTANPYLGMVRAPIHMYNIYYIYTLYIMHIYTDINRHIDIDTMYPYKENWGFSIWTSPFIWYKVWRSSILFIVYIYKIIYTYYTYVYIYIISSIIYSYNITHINKTNKSSIGGEVVISPRPDVVAWSPSWASSGMPARGRRCPLGAPRCPPLRLRITRVEWNMIQHLDILAGSMLIWRISNEL